MHRVGKHAAGTARRGRPLLGAEPLSERVTVLVTPSTMAWIESRAGGHVGEYVRRVLDGAKRGSVGRRRKRRFTK